MAIVTVKKSITIHADPLTVFDVIADFDHYHEWNPWVTRVQGRCVQGDVVTATRRWLGFDLTVHHQIVEMVFPEKIRWVATDWHRSLVKVERERLVFPCADGSTLYTVKLLMSGPLARVAAMFAGASLKEGMKAETLALKLRCETVSPKKMVRAVGAFRRIRSADLSGEHQVEFDPQ